MRKWILCYGDSNTWGYLPSQGVEEQRYSPDLRWTGVLQALLGKQYKVVEEGLNSRTTDLDYLDKQGRNGLTLLPSVLKQHSPLDLVILLLGSNDLKAQFNRSAERIGEGVDKLIDCTINPCADAVPRISVLSPPTPKFENVYAEYKYPGLEEKARKLGPIYQAVAQAKGASFIDLAPEIESSSVDGIHLDAEQHRKLAHLLHPHALRLA